MNGLGSDPSQVVDFDSIRRERKKLFSDEFSSIAKNQVYLSVNK